MDGPAAAACRLASTMLHFFQTGLKYRRLGWRFRSGLLLIDHRPWRGSVKVVALLLYVCTILRVVTNVTDWRGYLGT